MLVVVAATKAYSGIVHAWHYVFGNHLSCLHLSTVTHERVRLLHRLGSEEGHCGNRDLRRPLPRLERCHPEHRFPRWRTMACARMWCDQGGSRVHSGPGYTHAQRCALSPIMDPCCAALPTLSLPTAGMRSTLRAALGLLCSNGGLLRTC